MSGYDDVHAMPEGGIEKVIAESVAQQQIMASATGPDIVEQVRATNQAYGCTCDARIYLDFESYTAASAHEEHCAMLQRLNPN